MVTYIALVSSAIEAQVAGNRWLPMMVMVATRIGVLDDLAHSRGFRKDSKVFLEFELIDRLGCR